MNEKKIFTTNKGGLSSVSFDDFFQINNIEIYIYIYKHRVFILRKNIQLGRLDSIFNTFVHWILGVEINGIGNSLKKSG